MQKKLLHRILLILGLVLVITRYATGQQEIHVVKETPHDFWVENNPEYEYIWFIEGPPLVTLPDVSRVTAHKIENITFYKSGQYIIKVAPRDKNTYCYGKTITLTVTVDDVTPNAVLVANNEWICSENTGANENNLVKLRVNYSGPKPWTFKYNVNKGPSQQPTGADEITSDYFEFELSFRNESSRTKEYEVQLVEAKSLLGIPISDDPVHQTVKFHVLPLPLAKFDVYDTVVIAGSTQNYTATIGKNSYHEIILPASAVLVKENNFINSDNQTRQIDFSIQWGNTPGNYQIKFLEQNAFLCYGDTVYANVKLAGHFHVSLESEVHLCQGSTVELIPVTDLPGTYSYLWSDNSTDSILEVEEAGIYSVTVTSMETGYSDTANVNVIVHPLPVVDLGEDVAFFEGETVELDAGFLDNETIYEWNTGEQTQKITVNRESIYSVKITNQYGCYNTDEVRIFKKEGSRFSVYLGEDQEICEGDQLYLEPVITPPLSPEPTYEWISSGEMEKGIFANKAGTYCVKATDSFGNSEEDCMMLIVNPRPLVDLGKNLILQEGETTVLDAKNPGSFYNWSTGEITQTITVDKAGTYWVEVMQNKACAGTDTVVIEYRDDEGQFAALPTGFSPNGDGINDILYVRGGNIASMNLMIINRFGELIFQSKRQEVGWDGTFRGKKQEMDVYVYFLKVTFQNGKTILKQGNITLLN